MLNQLIQDGNNQIELNDLTEDNWKSKSCSQKSTGSRRRRSSVDGNCWITGECSGNCASFPDSAADKCWQWEIGSFKLCVYKDCKSFKVNFITPPLKQSLNCILANPICQQRTNVVYPGNDPN